MYEGFCLQIIVSYTMADGEIMLEALPTSSIASIKKDGSKDDDQQSSFMEVRTLLGHIHIWRNKAKESFSTLARPTFPVP